LGSSWLKEGIVIRHVIVAYDKTKWCAVPANNGGNGPIWQWGNELLVGFTQGEAFFGGKGHQVDDGKPQLSLLARSNDRGETWYVHNPEGYQGDAGFRADDVVPLVGGVDFTSPGFVMRVEGHGYHGNAGQQWFYSLDKGLSWNGPYTFGSLIDHPELQGKEITSRTAYIVNGPNDCFLFLSVRGAGVDPRHVSTTDKVFLVQTTDGGASFQFVSWVVPPSDPSRAVMPAPVRLSADRIVVAIRRRNNTLPSCWVDCFQTEDNGENWTFLSKVGDTGGSNGNPPAMIRMSDGRLCCVFGNRDRAAMVAKFSADRGATWGPDVVLRDDFQSINGFNDLGYARLFQRPDGKLATVYFWCSPERPETHIEATLFDAPSGGGGSHMNADSALESDAPVRYVGGNALVDKHYHDGQLPPVVGVHTFQVLRANRTNPPDAEGLGFTYNHAPMIAYWKGYYYLEFLCSHHDEHGDPTHTLLTRSTDGRTWESPYMAFPAVEWQPGKFTIAHQRMGFYVAPNDRLLVLSFYGIWQEGDITRSPNMGYGLGRAVREIHENGSMGPIYFLRTMSHIGYTEETTRQWFPFFECSDDEGFKAACRALLGDKLITQQMWEEDRAEDGFFAIDDATPGFSCKALSFYHRKDGKVVGLWKLAWAALSEDEGVSWTSPSRVTSKPTVASKEWGQQTPDGRYALVWNPTTDGEHRYPLAIATSDDGQAFDHMLLVHGEVPAQRYTGWHREYGHQYVRGIMEGNGVPPSRYFPVVFSVNKEDIWISHIPSHVYGDVTEDVRDTFDDVGSGGFIANWNVYMPTWTSVTVRDCGDCHCLHLADSNPTDYAKAVRVFPRATKLQISFRIRALQEGYGRLDLDVLSRKGGRIVRISLDGRTGAILANNMAPQRVVASYQKDVWYDLFLDIDRDFYDLSINGQKMLRRARVGAFREPAERLEFRTGPYRREDARFAELELGYSPGMSGADTPGELAAFQVDHVIVTSLDH
jgi:hypothetical protein